MRIRRILVCAFWLSGVACAQNYPDKSVRVVVPFPPGGAADVVGRAITQKLTEVMSSRSWWTTVRARAGTDG